MNKLNALLVSVLSLGFLTVGCAGGDDQAPNAAYAVDPGPGPVDPTDPTDPTDPMPISCEEGAVKSCKVTLPGHDGIENCFVGVQVCSGGSWSACGDADDLPTYQDQQPAGNDPAADNTDDSSADPTDDGAAGDDGEAEYDPDTSDDGEERQR